MDQRRNDYLKEAYLRDEILVMSEFDFPFLRFDILPRDRTIILCLQGFGLVNIIGLNPDFARIGDLAISSYSHMNVHENLSLVENKEWNRELDNHCQAIG